MTHSEPDIKMRIMLAAKKLFSQKGYDGTSIRQICEEACANVALVSYHFGGKEGVFQAIFEHFFPHRQMLGVDFNAMSPVDGLTLLIKNIMYFTSRDRQLSDIIHQEMMMNSPRRSIVMKYLKAVWSEAQKLLIRGKKEGVFSFESSSTTLLIIKGVALSNKRTYDFEDIYEEDLLGPDEAAEEAVRFILQGLGVNKP
ncbi:TetR family transcriptional regulator [Paenibacillus sp. JX-17]|uniref:TetR family transcriptional regulator n=1 Tax=Paenibacillus lacisoli TaxID=3064525 RepID=A0ABT9CDS6_9BACL|nr:TetR family transcriptional regulator [Paenibacillus sp. JX-17]MDO7906789.1 TetR family transcriptional regulator [Paenibacillus sp. JX-17]